MAKLSDRLSEEILIQLMVNGSKKKKKIAKQRLLVKAKEKGLCEGTEFLLIERLAKGNPDAKDILLALAEGNKLSNDSNERLKELVKNA